MLGLRYFSALPFSIKCLSYPLQPLSSQAPIRTAGSGPTTVTIQQQGTQQQQQLLQVRGSISTLQQQPPRPVGTINQTLPQLSSTSGQSTTGVAAVHSGEMSM